MAASQNSAKMPKRAYNDRTLSLKAEVVKRSYNEPTTKLSKEYGIPESTISTWKKNSKKIIEEASKSAQPNRKRMRFSEYPDIEKALLYWLKKMRALDNPPPLSSSDMLRQAERFATQLGYENWSATRGFLQRFCHRYAVVSRRMCGERNDCPDFDRFVEETLIPLLQEYNADDVYNSDETNLSYKLLPHRTYAFRGEQVYGSKANKDRLTLMLCSNMTGSDKLRPLIIGKTQNPRCLKQIYNMGVGDLPVHYYGNKKGWMTGFIFDDWLCKWNSKLVMAGRKILLLIDNAPSHVVKTYSNIRIQFLPPNTTSKLQPMDQGILRSTKLHYRRLLSDRYLDGIENAEAAKELIKRLDIKQACDMAVQAWKNVKPSLIQNCFSKAGFLHYVPNEPAPDPQPDPETWQNIQHVFSTTNTFEEYAVADNNVETSPELTDAEIVEQVMLDNMPTSTDEPESDSDEEDLVEVTPPNQIKTVTECLDMVCQIRTYFQKSKLETEHIDAIEQMILNNRHTRANRQTNITTFFKNNSTKSA